MPNKTAGQIGYEAYRKHTEGVSIATGQAIPEWRYLSDQVRLAWEAAGRAIVDWYVES